MRFAIPLLASAALALFATGSSAQQPAERDYPSKPIRLVVPYVAGGPNDVIAHTLAQHMLATTGQNMIVDNRGGAGSAIGNDAVAKSTPDGYSILLNSSSFASLPSMSKSLPYDPVKDFTPITQMARGVGSVMVVHSTVPAKSTAELIALARAQPGRISFASGGSGSASHLTAELFKSVAGIDIIHVPYKGVGQAFSDLLSGRVELSFFSPPIVFQHVQAGKLRALAVTAPSRISDMPDVPTMEEAGIKGANYVLWYGLWFPAGAAPAHVARIRSEVVKMFDNAAIRRKFLDERFLPVASSPQEFSRLISEEIELHRKLVARIGLAPQ